MQEYTLLQEEKFVSKKIEQNQLESPEDVVVSFSASEASGDTLNENLVKITLFQPTIATVMHLNSKAIKVMAKKVVSRLQIHHLKKIYFIFDKNKVFRLGKGGKFFRNCVRIISKMSPQPGTTFCFFRCFIKVKEFLKLMHAGAHHEKIDFFSCAVEGINEIRQIKFDKKYNFKCTEITLDIMNLTSEDLKKILKAIQANSSLSISLKKIYINESFVSTFFANRSAERYGLSHIKIEDISKRSLTP
ncbi:unnamed protein product [Moneuplotes crassus]|uniref:Uncharacterized protein n=1 Tax=Euplotes crassus TaxID=5936 RepID=A0AAD1XR47_EUPCR|nr:unnamed protein product [Moneuplotes crassus]